MTSRQELLAECERINHTAALEDRDCTDAEQAQFDSLIRKVKQMDAAVRKQPDPSTLRSVDHPLQSGKKKQPTFAHALLQCVALAAGEKGAGDLGLAKEIDSETRKRNPWKQFPSGVAIPMSLLMKAQVEKATPISALAGGQAVSAVGIEWMDSLFYETGAAIPLPLITERLGVRQVVGTEETVKIPRLTGRVAVSWIPRDGNLPLTDASFDAITVLPKTLGAIVTLKRSTLLYALHPNVESLIPNMLQESCTIAVDEAALFGPGGDAPTGVYTVATPGPALSTLASAYLIENQLIAYQKSLAGAKWLLGNLALGKLATSPAWTGAFVPAMQPGGTLAGLDVVMGMTLPDGTVPLSESTYMLGNWPFLVVVIWDSATIQIDPYANFQSGALNVRLLMDCNAITLDPLRFIRGDAAILT